MKTAGRFRKERLPDPLTYYKKQGLRLSGGGKWRSARCPFHPDRDPSLSIHVPSGGFNCHGCPATGGDVLDFHRRRHGLDFKSAAQDLGAWDLTDDVSQSTDRRVRKQAGDPVKLAARWHAERKLGKTFKPEALHTYRDEKGDPLYWVIRARDPHTGEKWIRPMRRDGSRYVLGKPTFEHGTPLYGLELLASRRNETIIVCEGEKCADALRKCGLLAITSGGAKSASGADWTPLSGRRVIIWPDHDEPGQRYAMDVREQLISLGCEASVIDSIELGLGENGDAVDWLDAHPEATSEIILELPRLGTPNAAPVIMSTFTNAGATSHSDLDVIARWCTERCVCDPRAWVGITALYRDLCDWCGPEYEFAPGEFIRLLAERGIERDGDFAKGIALACTLDSRS